MIVVLPASYHGDTENHLPSDLGDCACRQSHLRQIPGSPSGAWKPRATWSSAGAGEVSQWSKMVKFNS